MKRFLCLFAGIILLFGLQNEAIGAPAEAPGFKIGVLDIQKLQQKSRSFQQIKDKLRVKFDVLQKKLEDEKNQLMKIEQELQKQSLMLSLDAKEDKERELEKKTRYYKYIYEEYGNEMKYVEFEAMRDFRREIQQVVAEIGKKQGYSILLEANAAGLVYYKDTVDITDDVIKAYDKAKK